MAYAHPRVTPPTLGHALSRQEARLSPIAPTARIDEALQQLLEPPVEALVVMNGHQLQGVFSRHDFVRFMAQGGTLAQPVSAAMSACLVRAAAEDPVETWLEKMNDSAELFLPVFAGERLLGLLSRTNLLAESDAYHRHVLKEMALDHRIMFLRGTYSC